MINIKEKFVTLEVAQLLKEAGFDWCCEQYYYDDGDEILECRAEPLNYNSTVYAPNCNDQCWTSPTQAEACRWVREVKGWNIEVQLVKRNPALYSVNLANINDNSLNEEILALDETYQSYEDAVEAGLLKYLETIIVEDEEKNYYGNVF